MPSRPVVAAILLFWTATLGFVLHRDVWPRLVASGPPPIAVDLSDEASQFVPVRWSVLRGDERIGRLTTRMAYVDADDTFQFTHHYTQLQFDFPGAPRLGIPGVRIALPELITTTRVTRSGALREQAMDGKMVLLMEQGGEFRPVAEARVKVQGRVENGVFSGPCEIVSPLFTVTRDLDPVPVPEGHALSPLQPVNRIANIRPGQRWVVREVNPLDEAVAALVQEQFGKHGVGLPERKREALIAEVQSAQQSLPWGKDEVSCWVIEYRGGDARARTWVRVSDGKVLRQEAFGMGERIALEREE